MEKVANVASVNAWEESAVARTAEAEPEIASHVKAAKDAVQLMGNGPVGRVAHPESVVSLAEGVSDIVLAHVRDVNVVEMTVKVQAEIVSSATIDAAQLMASSLIGAPGVAVTRNVVVDNRSDPGDARAKNVEARDALDLSLRGGTATSSAAPLTASSHHGELGNPAP